MVSMVTPALETQYSPREVELVYAEQEETLTIRPRTPSLFGWDSIRRAAAWVRNMVPLVLTFITRS